MLSASNRAVKYYLIIITALVILKVAVGAITGSLSILAQSADSFFDLSAVIISFILARIVIKPADSEHPFGHGKVENVASALQVLVIFIIGGLTVFIAVERIIHGETIQYLEAGMAVMLLAILASIFLSQYFYRVAKANNSAELERNARNIATVKYTAVAVLVGLIIIRFTGLTVIDPIIALLIALWIFKEGIDVLRRSSPALIDERLPEDEEKTISDTLNEHLSQLVGFHNLRTRKSGYQRYIDLHLVVPKNTSVAEAHKITEHLEQDIRNKLPHTSMIIHIEPCETNCTDCEVPCNLKNTTNVK